MATSETPHTIYKAGRVWEDKSNRDLNMARLWESCVDTGEKLVFRDGASIVQETFQKPGKTIYIEYIPTPKQEHLAGGKSKPILDVILSGWDRPYQPTYEVKPPVVNNDQVYTPFYNPLPKDKETPPTNPNPIQLSLPAPKSSAVERLLRQDFGRNFVVTGKELERGGITVVSVSTRTRREGLSPQPLLPFKSTRIELIGIDQRHKTLNIKGWDYDGNPIKRRVPFSQIINAQVTSDEGYKFNILRRTCK